MLESALNEALSYFPYKVWMIEKSKGNTAASNKTFEHAKYNNACNYLLSKHSERYPFHKTHHISLSGCSKEKSSKLKDNFTVFLLCVNA